MSKSAGVLEDLLAQAGVNVAAAKAAVAKLDAAFGGEAGDIPDQALAHCMRENINEVQVQKFLLLIGKRFEDEAEKGEERKWEKAPNAAEIKAKKNLEEWNKRHKK